MSALDDYKALDLKSGSELDQSLSKRAADEQAAQGLVQLSDDFSILPFGMTPQMQGWYLECIAPVRGRALAELTGLFAEDTYGDAGAKGHLHEAEQARLRQTLASDRRDAIVQFYRGHETRIKERDSARRDYDAIRAREGNREPVAPPNWRYVLGLLAIFVPEIFLNFESLERLPFIKSPFMATGATLILALGLGFAAHVHGEILKQWHWYFGPQDRVRAWQGGRLLIIAETALWASMAFIGYARHSYIMPRVEEALLLGQTPPSVFLSVLFMVSSNFLVFLIGLWWSYVNHDLNPEYPKKYRKWLKHRTLFDLAFLQLKGELGRLDAKYAEDVARLEDFESTQRNAPNYNRNRELIQVFLAADSAVRGALERYRTTLVKRLREEGHEPQFVLPVVKEDGGTRELLDAQQYLAGDSTLHLKVLTHVN